MVKFQIRSEGCRVGRSGRSVADSLFRPHPEQRARALREPKNVFLQMYRLLFGVTRSARDLPVTTVKCLQGKVTSCQ